MTIKPSNFLPLFEPKRDAYGFTVRPQHLQRFREYGSIYKEEEDERTEKWKRFIEQLVEPDQLGSSDVEIIDKSEAGEIEQKSKVDSLVSVEGDHSSNGKPSGDIPTESYDEGGAHVTVQQAKSRKVQTWTPIRPSLHPIVKLMSARVKKNVTEEKIPVPQDQLESIEEDKSLKGEENEDHGEEFFENEAIDDTLSASEKEADNKLEVEPETFFPWKEELEFLVRGGVPRDLRGEIWQAFAGVSTRRVKEYYQSLLGPESDYIGSTEHCEMGSNEENAAIPEKWRKQIEKDLPRTFPGHPALDEVGRNSLRRLLIAYARHNPSVGYCQAMNFFAGLLLLMMPEENAFWTLVGIIDDYFCGYYSEEMIESQVDQLVFEELVRERFPKLVNHLDYLGVQVTWLSGPWFLSIFVNILPWESVLRIWDVLLFEGNRVMLFCTSLALMELYGPALVTTKDAGDAITLLQSLAGSTFDSSQLVLTACMGFLAITEERLEELREKHRPTVIEAAEERSRGRVSKDSKSLASKLYSFKHDGTTSTGEGANAELVDNQMDGGLKANSADADSILNSINLDSEADSVPDLQEQVVWLKVQLCTMLEERRSATLRAEELETALMEMVKLDNRRQLSARVEQLEQEVSELRQTLTDKKEQEQAMLQVLMRVEQDQKVTEDARIFAEQDAAAQKYAVHMLQEKHEKSLGMLAQMEKRVQMAESMLEATLQYEKGQNKAVSSPRSLSLESPRDAPVKRGLLSFGLGWRDRNKGKQSNTEESSENRSEQGGGSGQQEQQDK
ncbi:rab GTPase-activating protein 1-like [Impatiens glandulifera]|uniref:rab GTPase-activating protein 1-like n=1 Tax=Impatiens glandulifera TaxID=253017 RepID=UPI001FB194E3|nr:rab GTPase-activating protein 1-like [Impatiens glandulifera]